MLPRQTAFITFFFFLLKPRCVFSVADLFYFIFFPHFEHDKIHVGMEHKWDGASTLLRRGNHTKVHDVEVNDFTCGFTCHFF